MNTTTTPMTLLASLDLAARLKSDCSQDDLIRKCQSEAAANGMSVHPLLETMISVSSWHAAPATAPAPVPAAAAAAQTDEGLPYSLDDLFTE